MRHIIFLVLIIVFCVSSVRAEEPLPWRGEPEKPPAPAAKFFPINPATHMLPVTRSPYGVRPSQPLVPAKKQSLNQGTMNETQARQILSMYPN